MESDLVTLGSEPRTAEHITSKVLDRHGQTQAHLVRSTSGVWSIHPTENHGAFIVKFDDPSFRNVLASKKPWDCVEWSISSRIDVLLELLYWVCALYSDCSVEINLCFGTGIQALNYR